MTGSAIAAKVHRFELERVYAEAEWIAGNGIEYLFIADANFGILPRDVEIAVVDAARGFGNGRLLPAGPLREDVARLDEVDAVVVNGPADWSGDGRAACGMALLGTECFALNEPGRRVPLEAFRGRKIHAVAGIGNPDRFFDALADRGLEPVRHPFPDHYAYRPGDLPQGTVIMTEKDAVKCAKFSHPDAWVYVVDAVVSGGLEHIVLTKLERRDGQQAA